MTSQIDITEPKAGNPATAATRANFAAAKTEIEELQGPAYISGAVSVRRKAGITFNTDDAAAIAANVTALQAVQQEAYDNGKFVVLDYVDRGYLGVDAAGTILANTYGGDGPAPEIRYIGDLNCWTVTESNVTLKNIFFNRPFMRQHRIASMSRSSNIVTAVYKARHPFEVGDVIWAHDLGADISGWFARGVNLTVQSVPDAATNHKTVRFIHAGADLTYDAGRTVALVSARREGSKLFLEATAHNFYPGQKISVPTGQHIKPGQKPGVTSPQTLDITTDLSGSTGYIQGVTVAGLAKGDSVWTATGEIPTGTIIRDIVGTTVYLNTVPTAPRTGASVIFARKSMDISRATIIRVPSVNLVVVDDIGPDDPAAGVDVNGASIYIADTEDDRWAGFRGNLSSGPDLNQTLLVNASGIELIDVSGSGTAIKQNASDFLHLRCKSYECAWTSFLYAQGAVRGRVQDCLSEMNGDDHFAVLHYQYNKNVEGEIQFINNTARFARIGHGLIVSGSTKVYVEGHLAEYCQGGYKQIYDQGSWDSWPGNNVHVKSATIRGCGQVVTSQMGTVTTGAVTFANGADNTIVDRMIVQDSNGPAVWFANAAGDYELGDFDVGWSRSDQGLMFTSSGNVIGKVKWKTLRIAESYQDALYVAAAAKIASSIDIETLELEDINRINTTTRKAITLETGMVGNVNIGRLRWKKQRYTIGTPWFSTAAAENNKIRVGSIELPWHMNATIAARQLPTGLIAAARTAAAVDLKVGSTEYLMTVLPEARGKVWYPAGLTVLGGGSGTVTSYGNIEVRDAAAGAGNVLVAAGKTWLSLSTNFCVDLSRKLVRQGTCTSGSAVVQFGWDGSTNGASAPPRMDEVMLGMDISSSRFAAGTYVTAVDRAAQTVTMSSNATSTGESNIEFTGMVPDGTSVKQSNFDINTADIAGTQGVTPYLRVISALTGTVNVAACHVYLIGRLA